MADLTQFPGCGVIDRWRRVLRAANRAGLKENGTVVYLHADPLVLWDAYATAATARAADVGSTQSPATLYDSGTRCIARWRFMCIESDRAR
jgi:shikimate kinase